MADTGRSAGRVLIRPLGAYDATVTYEMLDSVEYEGTSYLCKTTSLGHLPTETDYWQKLASATPLPPIDNVPTEDSENLVKSGGVYGAIENAAIVIKNSEGTSMPHRSSLQFANATVTDDTTNDATVITTSGGGGLHIGDVDNFASGSTVAVQKITLTWDDPDDIVISGVVQAAWGGTKIVRKAGSIPVSEGDGTIVVDSTTRNQYSVTGFEDNTVAFDTTYYYRAFPYTTDGTVTNGSYVSDEAIQIHIYGVEWDGTASRVWSRTDDAANFTNPVPYYGNITSEPSSPFDNRMPWAGMTVEERTGGTMVKIPKFWYKLTQDGDSIQVKITNVAAEGYHVSPAHMDRGDGGGERDVVYIGRYHCGTGYKSVATSPLNNITRATARTSIHNLGSNIWQMDFAIRFTIWLLYIVEFANWDSQYVIGAGGGNGNSKEIMGYTDSMPYHTGTMANSRAVTGCNTQYRNIEGLWDNEYDWLDGCYYTPYNPTTMHIILNPASFSDNTGGIASYSIAGYGYGSGDYPNKLQVKDVEGAFPLFVPAYFGGSKSTYTCDCWRAASASLSSEKAKPCLYAGGYYGTQDGSNGIWRLGCDDIGNAYVFEGCRLMELP